MAHLAAYEAASISNCRASRAKGIRNGNTSVAPAARPPPEAPRVPDVGAAEELDDGAAGSAEPEEEEEEDEAEDRTDEEREVGTSSCLHLLTR